MKKLLSITALCALLLGLPSASFAEDKKEESTAAPTKEAAAPKAMPFHAEVTSIDAAGKSFVHKNKDGKEVKHVITDKTTIKNGEAAAKFEDIKVGDMVSGLRTKKSDTEYEVNEITKFGPKTAKKPKSS